MPVNRDPKDDEKPSIVDPQQTEDRYWKHALGTTDLAARGYRSFWD